MLRQLFAKGIFSFNKRVSLNDFNNTVPKYCTNIRGQPTSLIFLRFRLHTTTYFEITFTI